MSTSAGYSFYPSKKREVWPQIIDKAEKLHNLIKHDIKCGSFNPSRVHFPYCLAAQQRAMVNMKEGQETRLVWIYPTEMLAIEARYAKPLYDAYTKKPMTPMMIGGDTKALIANWMGKYHPEDGDSKLYGVHFSDFDAHVQADLIKVAFLIAFDQVDLTDPEVRRKAKSHRDRNVHICYEEAKHKIMKEAIQCYFIHTPILMADGRTF